MAKIKIPGIEITIQECLNGLSYVKRIFSRRRHDFDRDFERHSAKCDWCFYQLGIRPQIPVVDFYYLQYLRSLLDQQHIDTLVIYPSIDLTFPSQQTHEYDVLKARVLKIFESHSDRITFIDPSLQKTNLGSIEFLSEEFLTSLKYIASTEFRDMCRKNLGKGNENWTWRDCNKYHPETLRLVSIYVHTVRGYIMWRFLMKELEAHPPSTEDTTRIGFLMWETEMAKLAVFRQQISRHPKLELCPILGSSILITKDEPLPVFEPDKTVTVHGDLRQTLDILTKCSATHNRLISSILDAVLRKNYTGVPKRTRNELRTFERSLHLGNTHTSSAAKPAELHALDAAWLIDRFQRLLST